MGEISNVNDYFLDSGNFGNYSLIQRNGQRIIRQVDPSGQEIPSPGRGLEIIVKNIPGECDENMLFVLFSQAGVIYEMRVMVTHDDRCRGIAFVKYFNCNQCKLAMTLFNGKRVMNKTLVVEESREYSELIFSGVPATVPMQEVVVYFKNNFTGVYAVHEVSSSEGIRKVAVAFASHRDAALIRRQFTSRKQTSWNSHITADWPVTVRRLEQSRREVGPVSRLDLTLWERIDENVLTQEFWDEFLTDLWFQHLGLYPGPEPSPSSRARENRRPESTD